MKDEFRTVAEPFRYEAERIKGSRFLANVAPVSSTETAEGLLKQVRAEFSDASHHCWAYRLGRGGEEFRSSDDGEPSGSAGRPILTQLEGHDLTQLIVVVTRWFGGTKLGVGGLMRAYGGTAGHALDRAPLRTVVISQRIEIQHPYECSGPVSALFSARNISPKSAKYGAHVELEIELPVRDVEDFCRELRDCTAGRAMMSILED